MDGKIEQWTRVRKVCRNGWHCFNKTIFTRAIVSLFSLLRRAICVEQKDLLAGESNPALPRSGDGGFRHWQAGVGADETAILTDILARIDDDWQKHGSKNSIIVIIFFYRYFGMTDYIHEDFILMKPLHQWRPKSHFYSYSAPYWLVKLKADTRWSRWLHRA